MELLIALRTDPTVRRYLGGPMTHEAAAALAHFNIAHPHWLFAVTRRDRGETIGLVMLHPGHGGTEVSYQFLPSACSQGLASEAVQRVVDYAFDAGGIEELLAVTQTANERSCRLLGRLGMTVSEEFEEFGARQTLYKAHRTSST
jgi:ribosomal-protein-alanine N-acetyltransferase